MKAYTTIIEEDKPWHIQLTRKGTIGQPWNKMLKAMLEGMIGVNDKPSFPVYL